MVYVLLANGFEEIEAIAVIDILRRAGVKVKTFSITSSTEVKGAHDVIINADDIIENIDDKYDVLFLPGGAPGYINLQNSPEVTRTIKNSLLSQKCIAAICAAPSVLGELGLLEGEVACCYPGFEDKLIGAEVSYNDVCISGNFITSRGAGTAHKLGFTLVEKIVGKEKADELRAAMIY